MEDRNEPCDASPEDGRRQRFSMGKNRGGLGGRELSCGRRDGGLEVFYECASSRRFSRSHFSAPRVRRGWGNPHSKGEQHPRRSSPRSPIPEEALARKL